MPSLEDVRRFLAELARRRVFQVVAVYGGAAFAFLQGADIVVEALGLSPRLVTTLTILVLVGFVVALVVGWRYDLDAEGRLLRTDPAEIGNEAKSPARAAVDSAETAVEPFGWPARMIGIVALVAVGSVSWIIASRVSPPEPAYAVSDPRGSFLVAPIGSRSQSSTELALAERAAGRLMWMLRGWETVRVVQEVALSGMLYDLEIGDDRAPDLDQALQMARTQRVGTLIGLRLAADTSAVHLEATLYDVASRREIHAPHLVAGSSSDLDALVAPVARAVLELRNQDVDIERLRSESRDPAAHRDFAEGLTALWDWRLIRAEEHFRDAIAADSMFAAAYHYLALALYWQTARDGERVLEHGPEVARLTQTASRLATARDLRPGLRGHIEAMRAFWAGDYERGRAEVRALLAADSSDTEAWLLLGAIEVTDPYLARDGTGEPRPRRNPNVARRAFERAIELSPDLQLSYGHLFALDRELVANAALGLGCPAFERPDAPRLPPFVAPEAGRQEAFCAVARDTVAWVPGAELQSLDLARVEARALSQMRRTRTLLENWVRIHPDQPRPHEELDRWLSWRRSLAHCANDTAALATITRTIGEHREEALELRRDTTPEDRSRLALLRLANGNPETALELLAPLEHGSSDPAPPSMANIYLAVGLTERAIDAAAGAYADATWGLSDPESGAIVFAGDVADQVREVTIRGATGDGSEQLGAALRELLATWDGPEYSPRESVLLREAMLRFGIEPGLLIQPEIRRAWFADWQARDVAVPARWRQSREADPPGSTASDMFMEGALAWERNELDTAVDRLSRLEGCPLSLDEFDAGWGLRTLGRFYLARVHEARGDSAAYAAAMDLFTNLWRGRPEGPATTTRR